MGVPVRGEQWKLAYAVEGTYGSDPGTAEYTNVFGVVQSASMPDPAVEFNPIWTLGTASKRDWYIAYRGRMTLSGSVPDIWLLDGRPLRFPVGSVSDAGSDPYTHTISEATTLSSIALHVTIQDADGNNELMRRFLGGKIGRATYSATEGEQLRMSLDDIMFTNYIHDQSGETGYNAGVADITPSYPTTQPYLFSYGALSLAGTEFARVRAFRLEVNNNLEPKYYVTDDATNQLPYEHREGRREYRFACTIDVEDSSLYKELVRQGIYSSVYKGFTTEIVFTRDTNDTITFTMPGTTPGAGGNEMGCLIMNAKHNIVTDPLLGVDLDIIGRELKIVVVDSIETYP